MPSASRVFRQRNASFTTGTCSLQRAARCADPTASLACRNARETLRELSRGSPVHKVEACGIAQPKRCRGLAEAGMYGRPVCYRESLRSLHSNGRALSRTPCCNSRSQRLRTSRHGRGACAKLCLVTSQKRLAANIGARLTTHCAVCCDVTATRWYRPARPPQTMQGCTIHASVNGRLHLRSLLTG